MRKPYSLPLTVVPAPDLILLRHGETQWNREYRYQGQKDSPLTLTGIAQVRAVAETLLATVGDVRSCCIWSSSLPRTRQSVSVLCDQLGLDYGAVRFDDRLMERSYGRWEGLTLEQIEKRYRQDLGGEQKDRWGFTMNGTGESFSQVEQRLRSWLDDLDAGQHAIVMTHGGSGRVLRGILTGQSPEEIFADHSPQSVAFSVSNQMTKIIPADIEQLRKFGCADQGLGVRI